MAEQTPEELHAALLDDWNAAKVARDQAIAAAWALEEPSERLPAVQAAKDAWENRKAELLERQATLPTVS